MFFGGALERTEIRPGTNIPAAYLAYAQRFGFTSNTLPLSLGWSRDDRDSAIAPTRGRYQRLAAELSMAGDAHYLRSNYQFQQYIRVTPHGQLNVSFFDRRLDLPDPPRHPTRRSDLSSASYPTRTPT